MKQLVSTICLSVLLAFSISCSKDSDDPIVIDPDPVHEYSIDKQEFNAPEEGGDFTAKIKSNIQWTASSKDSWITLKTQGAKGDAELVFTVGLNDIDEERTGEIIVGFSDAKDEKKIKVTQAASSQVPEPRGPNLYVKATADESNNGLTWETATSLSKALKMMRDGDNIHIAAGTHIPTNKITGGDKERDYTFEINKNVTLIGGYPANATDGAVADKNNETILSGTDKFYHTVTVTAPVKSGEKITLKNLSIKHGKAGVEADGQVEVGGYMFNRNFGGGLSIGISAVDVIDCKISDNESEGFIAGVYVHSGAIAKLINTEIVNNSTTTLGGNCGGVHNAATTYLIGCNISDNSSTGTTAALYNYDNVAKNPTYMYIYNSTIARNTNRVDGGMETAFGAGLYARENSYTQIVNSTFYANECLGTGSTIAMYGVAGREAVVDVVSSTFYNNIGGGFITRNSNCKLNIYNSITTNNSRLNNFASNSATLSYTIEEDKVLDEAGNAIDGETFDYNTMISSMGANGTCMITASSPAATHGMSVSLLQNLAKTFNPVIDNDIITKDQINQSRSGKKAMGAVLPN